ncbi:SNF2 family N-terminal domain-containing protein [Cladorrhinum sp. PSN259]|nr:SNF2 family N-terminal domain-containing protein [Cladorrhinum sp. PSN259]
MEPPPDHGIKREATDDGRPVSKRRLVEENELSTWLGYPMELEIGAPTEDSDPTSLICYGALFCAKAQASFLADLTALPWIQFSTFPIILRNKSFFLNYSIAHETIDFAQLDLKTTGHLNTLQSLKNLTFTAVLSSSNLAKIPRKSTRKKTIIDITINILGPEELAEAVGDLLANVDCCLQHPTYLEPNIQYKNPHYFYTDGTMTDLRHLIGPVIKESESVWVSRRIDKIFESLGNVEMVDSVPRKEENLTQVRKCLHNTTLKDHQTAAIRFIMGRENASICHDTDRELWGLIDPMFISRLPSPGLGGILADVMGLGKTLTMLSAIVCAKENLSTAVQHGKVYLTGPSRPNTTLIVLPSRQLLDVWNSEIQSRFHRGTLSVVLFHQDTRAKSPDELLGYDVVLTTYHTLAADWKGLGVLQNITWLRIVLDEAHWIRNQSTGLFKSTTSLKAERRWCLTGTPIQNNLHDVRSLLKFLRHGPLSETKYFEKYINEPIRKDPTLEESFRNLQLVLRTVCLRRTEALLRLPPPTTEVIPIKLSSEEAALYKRLEMDWQEDYERQICTKAKVNTSALLFETIMKRRRLCNHGTYETEGTKPLSPSPSGKKRRSKQPSPLETTEGDSCVLCNTKDEDVVASLDAADECPLCARSLLANSTSQNPGPTSWLTVPETASRGSTPRRVSQMPSPIGSPMSLLAEPTGHSSKLTAVARNISESCATPGNKSVVFTSWRATLDLLSTVLVQRNIPYLRIDGTVDSTERTAILSQFNNDPAIPVLLLTIDSGAIGVTITSANRVHFVEPIYNPATEAQAIARAHRMGQTRPVTVIKYITEKTVETNILELQKRKRLLTKFSLDDQIKDEQSDSLDVCTVPFFFFCDELMPSRS